MAAQSESFDVAVVGGGAIGLACARRVARDGARVVVLDAGAAGAWSVAAGMLAPVSEVEFGERALLSLGLESARLYAEFCAALEDPGYRPVGTMVVARDRDEAEALDRLAEFRRGLGLPVERLRPSQARRLEPALAPTIRLALDIESDHSIDPRKLVEALRRAFGGELRRARVTGVSVAWKATDHNHGALRINGPYQRHTLRNRGGASGPVNGSRTATANRPGNRLCRACPIASTAARCPPPVSAVRTM